MFKIVNYNHIISGIRCDSKTRITINTGEIAAISEVRDSPKAVEILLKSGSILYIVCSYEELKQLIWKEK